MGYEIELDDFDFGFSAVSEEELQQKEKEAAERARLEAAEIIKQQQEESSAELEEATQTAEEYRRRLIALHKAILPLLNNLVVDSETKSFIYWPDRKAKIDAFRQRLEAIVRG